MSERIFISIGGSTVISTFTLQQEGSIMGLILGWGFRVLPVVLFHPTIQRLESGVRLIGDSRLAMGVNVSVCLSVSALG